MKLNEHTNDSSSFFGALGFTRQVELLALKTVPTESLLSWLTKPTSPHLVEAASEPEPLSALAILWTPEALHDLKSSKVGVGLVYKAPYILSASFCEAYFSLKSASKAEVGKRSYGPGLMFVCITEASLMVPHPIERPLYLDIKHPSYIMSSNTLRSPVVYRGFKLHKVHLVEGETRTVQVALPCLQGDSTHRMITYQKHQMTPEFRSPEIIDTTLAVAHEKHWNIVNDPVFAACLEEFKTRHEASKRTTSQTGPSARGTTLTMGPSSVVGPGPQSAPTSDAEEVREQVQEIMAKIFALRVQTVQEMGLVRETDRALSRALMAEFIRLHLIVGEDLNTSLQAMQTEMETISNELIRDLDIASRNIMGDPSGNPSVKVALNRFRELVRLKMSLPLAQLDAAHEDMDRFLHHRLSQLDAQKELKSLLRSLTERMAAHQHRVGEIIQGEALKNSEVSQQVMVGVGAEQPLESNFFTVFKIRTKILKFKKNKKNKKIITFSIKFTANQAKFAQIYPQSQRITQNSPQNSCTFTKYFQIPDHRQRTPGNWSESCRFRAFSPQFPRNT